MSAPIEAASLYVSVGEQGTNATIAQMQKIGGLVDKYAKSDVTATVSANISQADANLAKVRGEIDAFKNLHPEASLMVSGNAAVREIGVVESKFRELKASLAQKLSINLSGLGRTGANFGANALLSGGFNLRSAGATMLQGVAQGGGAGGAVAAMGGPVGLGAAAIAAIGGLALGKAGEMEKFQTQLEVLLGSVSAAKARIADLTNFAAKTPFELPEVVAASKQLQVFTGDALATGKGLQLVGDVASGTGSSFSETAMWFGRMYDAMKSGRPFGEATQRLQEMGAMSGQSREKIEKLAKGVKDGTITMDDAWAQASGEFGRFNGMMDKQSGTMEGKVSNLTDAIGQDFAKIGAILLPVAKIVLDVLVGAFGALGQAIEFVGPIISTVGGILGSFIGVVMNVVDVITKPLSLAFDVFRNVLGAVGDAVGGLGDILSNVFDDATTKAVKAQLKLAQTPQAIADDMRESKKIIGVAAQSVAREIPKSFAMADQDTVLKVRLMMHDVASEIAKGRQGIVDAMQATIDDTYDPLILAGKIAAERAELNSSELRKSLKSSDKGIHADAVARQLQLKKDLASDLATQTKYGDDASRLALLKAQAVSDNIVKGLKSGDKKRKAEAQAAAGDIATEMVKLEIASGHYGTRTGNAYIDGIMKALEAKYDALKREHAKIGGLMKASSPPGPESPLHDIDKWGYRTGETYILHLAQALQAGPERLRGGLRMTGAALTSLRAGSGPIHMGSGAFAGVGAPGMSGGDAHLHFDFGGMSPGVMTPAFAAEFVRQVGPLLGPWLRTAGYIPMTGR